MQSEIQNRSDEATQAVSIVYFDADPGLQFARNVWIPPNASREVWIPVLIPSGIKANQNESGEFVSVNANTLLLNRSGTGEQILQSQGQQLKDSAVISVDTKKPVTVQIAGPALESLKLIEDDSEDKIAHLTIQTMRIAVGFGKAVPNLIGARAPIVPATLDSADQIVLRGDRLSSDAPGRTALRQWVLNGGRLWIMLDTMEEETCRLVLGDACPVEYFDRVGLVEFQSRLPESKDADSENRGLGPASILSDQEHEKPVPFVRTFVDDVELLATIDGWPSIFKKEFGRGSILFTTIGARALSRPRKPDEAAIGPENATRLPQPELRRIATVMFAERKTLPVKPADFTPLIQQSIGYEVPNRMAILLILGTFCLGLLASGGWLLKTNRLGHLIWVAPAASFLATLPLIVMGSASRQSIPPTLIESQIIEVTPASDDILVRGMVGIFENRTTNQPYIANTTSVFVPDRTGISDTWRMVWDDLDHFQWENLSMPAGLRLIPFVATRFSSEPIVASGSFGPDGFVGSLDGPMANVRDAIIASQTHVSLGLNVENGHLAGPIENSLPPGQYTAESLLDDEQVSRQQIFGKLLDFKLGEPVASNENDVADIADLVSEEGKTPKHKIPDQPSLLAWSDGLELGFDFNAGGSKQTSALVIVPLQLDAPEPRELIRIPSVFVPYDSVRGPDNEGKSMAFESRLGVWQKRSRGSASNIRFQLPACVQPFSMANAKLKIKINAPSRTVGIQAGRIDNLVEVTKLPTTVGIVEVPINDRDAVLLDEDGGLHVRIFVDDIKSIDSNQNEVIENVDWKIEYVELEVQGTYVPAE